MTGWPGLRIASVIQKRNTAGSKRFSPTDQRRPTMTKPWDGIISEDEQRAYRAAGFGRLTGFGANPALLIIDVQYRTTGTIPRPFWELIKEFPTSCGDVAWRAVDKIQTLLTLFRERKWPVLYPYVSPKANFEFGTTVRQSPGNHEYRSKRL